MVSGMVSGMVSEMAAGGGADDANSCSMPRRVAARSVSSMRTRSQIGGHDTVASPVSRCSRASTSTAATSWTSWGAAAHVADPSARPARMPATAARLSTGGAGGRSGLGGAADAGRGRTPRLGTTVANHASRPAARRRTTWSSSGRLRPRSSIFGSSSHGSCTPCDSASANHSASSTSCWPPSSWASRARQAAGHGARRSTGAAGTCSVTAGIGRAPVRRATVTAAARSSTWTAGSTAEAHRSHPPRGRGGS